MDYEKAVADGTLRRVSGIHEVGRFPTRCVHHTTHPIWVRKFAGIITGKVYVLTFHHCPPNEGREVTQPNFAEIRRYLNKPKIRN